jgi:uroporphyrinogen-III decarboxylase
MWHFDQTEMKRALEVLGDVCAIKGNVPASLTTTGTPEQMTEYCQELLETCGPSGNFILGNGCQVDEAKDENLKAMIACAKES